MKHFSLFMLREGRANRFMGLEWTLNHGGVNLKDYEVVYTGVIEPRDTAAQTLEDIFVMFNINHPADYQNRSMSVSDLVGLEGDGLYFCDSIGFKKITGEEQRMNTYYKVAVERELNAVRSNVYTILLGEKPVDYKAILRDGKCVCFVGHFETQESAQRWHDLMLSRKLAQIDFMDRRRINCDACPERDACDQVKQDCPLDDPPAFSVDTMLPGESLPEYLSRVHGWPLRIETREEIATLCDVQQLDGGKLAPIYRFPGGPSLVSDDEMIPYDEGSML
ncbi:MAG: hypothetical protein IKZ30_01245 [Oscillospiraceae bacterium]|nr:hypothetical protein [Oscillospiraceae bacterium]